MSQTVSFDLDIQDLVPGIERLVYTPPTSVATIQEARAIISSLQHAVTTVEASRFTALTLLDEQEGRLRTLAAASHAAQQAAAADEALAAANASLAAQLSRQREEYEKNAVLARERIACLTSDLAAARVRVDSAEVDRSRAVADIQQTSEDTIAELQQQLAAANRRAEAAEEAKEEVEVAAEARAAQAAAELAEESAAFRAQRDSALAWREEAQRESERAARAETALEHANKQLAELRADLQRQLRAAGAGAAATAAELEEARNEAAQRRQEAVTAVAHAQQLEQQLVTLRAETSQAVSAAQTEVQQLRGELRGAVEARNNISAHTASLEAHVSSLTARVAELTGRCETAELAATELRSRLAETTGKADTTESDLAAALIRIRTLVERSQEQSAELDEAEKVTSTLERKLQTLRGTCKQLREERDSAVITCDRLVKEIEVLEKRYEEQELQRLAATEARLAAEKERREAELRRVKAAAMDVK